MADFAEFFATTRHGVFRAVFAATGTYAGAEDAVAEAYARGYASWARLRDHPNPTAWLGRFITATIAGDFFAVWDPDGGLEDAFVIVDRTEGGNLIGSPSALTGSAANVDGAFMRACQSLVRDRLVQAPGAGAPDDFTARVATRDGDWALVVFASPRLMTSCELTDAGIIQAAGTAYIAPLEQATFTPLSGMFSLVSEDAAVRPGPDRNWAVVAVPPGTQRGEFVLADGRSIEGRVDAGFMVGLWTGVDTGMPVMRAYTMDTVYEKLADKPVTTRPR